MPREQKIRAFLFYLSFTVFVVGLPFILSFALGYKFNRRTLQFTKTGLVVLKTQPPAASIYFGGRLLGEKTPATINELLPGRYNLKLELENYYPWIGQVDVDAGKVMRLEKIILFPLRANIEKLNKDKISFFWVDKEKKRIYYINQEENILYRSDLEGEGFKEITKLADIIAPPKKYKLSADREKLLCFNFHQVAVVYLQPQDNTAYPEESFILDYSNRRIIDVFWHSDSYHLILVTNKNIEVTEAKPQAESLSLVALNKKNASAFYDDDEDALYFMDTQRAADGKFYDNVYKLDLKSKASVVQELLKSGSSESLSKPYLKEEGDSF